MQQQEEAAIINFIVDSIDKFLASAENLEVDLLASIVILIQDSYTSTNNTYRKQRDAELRQIKQSMDWKKYLLNLFQIIHFSQNISQDNLERVMIESYSFITIESAYGAMNTEEYIILMSANVSCIVNTNIPAQLKKKHLINAFDKLLHIDVNGKDKVKSAVEQYIFYNIQNTTQEKAFSYTLILKQIISQYSLNEVHIDTVRGYLEYMSQIGISTLAQCETLSSKSEEEVLCIVEITHSLSSTCKHLVERSLCEIQIEDDMKKIVFKEDQNFHESPIFKLSGLYSQIIDLCERILSTSFSNECKILCLTPNRHLNNIFNKSKNDSIEMINLLLAYVFQLKKLFGHRFTEQETAIINEFAQRFENHLKFCLTQLHEVTLAIFSSNVDLTQDQTDIIQSVLILLSEMVEDFDYYQIFLQNRYEITANIVINFLFSTNTYYAGMYKNPMEFTLGEQDLATTRESNTMKTCAAKFLYNYCERIDGTLSWATIFFLKTIHMTLGQSGDYSELAPFEKSLLFSKFDANNRIETCLLGIIILTPLIEQREDLRLFAISHHLNDFMKSNVNLLVMYNSDVLKSRLCLLMGIMMSGLFKRDLQYFNYAMRFLFECLVNIANPAISSQALNSLEDITLQKEERVKKDEEVFRIEEIIFDILKYLEKIINQATGASYFEFLIQFLMKYRDIIVRYSANLIKLFTQRVWKEFNQFTGVGTNIVIIKCLDAINTIILFKDALDEYYGSFEEDLGYLLSILDFIDRIEFSDQLLLIASNVIRGHSLNSIIYQPIQRNMSKILKKNDDSIDIFFNLFYYWSVNGTLFITQENPELIKDMVDICLRSLESFPIGNLDKEYYHFSEACVCLQIIIQCFYQDQLAPVINDILARLDKIEKQLVSDQKRIVGFRFFQIYYCLIAYYPPETLRHINETELLYVLVEQIPFFCLKYFKDDTYSIKVISVGLISLFHNRTSLCLNQKLIKNCFISLVQILKYIPESTTVENDPKNNHKSQETNRSDPIEDLNEGDQYQALMCSEVLDKPKTRIAIENDKISARLRRLNLPILRKDEYQMFKEIFDQFKQSREEFENVMMDILDLEMNNNLNIILSTKNMASSISTNNVPRKQLTVKRKNA